MPRSPTQRVPTWRAEAAETQTWLRFSVECGYLAEEAEQELHQTYDYIIGKLVNMIINPSPWILKRSRG